MKHNGALLKVFTGYYEPEVATNFGEYLPRLAEAAEYDLQQDQGTSSPMRGRSIVLRFLLGVVMHSGFRTTGFAALLTLLVCAVTLAVPGCGRTKATREQAIERYTQELREAISTSVPEERRKEQMLLIVDDLEALHLRFNRETVDSLRGIAS